MSRCKRYCLYKLILFLLLLSLIFAFREKGKSLFPLIVFSSVFLLDELLVFFVQRRVKLYNLLLDVTYLSVLLVFTGGPLSPFAPFYLPLVVLSAYFLFPIDSFIVSGYSALSYGMVSIFLAEGIQRGFILIDIPEFPPLEIVLIEFVVYSFAFLFTAAVSSLVVQVWREQLAKVRVNTSDIVEAIDYGIITVDEEGNVVWSNSKAADFLKASFLGGRKLMEVTESPFKEPIEKILNREERRIEFESGDRVFMVRGSDLLDGKGTILMINDRTEEKEMERKMHMREKLVILGNFAANLAHEVRNPVSSIRASAELIGTTKDNLRKNKRLKKLIMKESDRLDYLVESFLDFTKSFDLESKDIPLYELIEEVIGELKVSKHFNNNVKFQNEIRKGITVKGDYRLLKSVFFNLGVNSLKSMFEKGGSLSFGVEEDGKPVIFVKDTGCGIKGQDLDKIFSPFYSHFKEGFGFGLPIVKKVLELHNWNIEIDSTVGEGTEMRIII